MIWGTTDVAIASPWKRARPFWPLLIAAGVFLWIPALLNGEWERFHFTDRTLVRSFYLIYLILGSIIGFSAYAYDLKHLPVATASRHKYGNPVIEVLRGTMVFREPFSAHIAVACGGVLVLAGSAIVKSAER